MNTPNENKLKHLEFIQAVINRMSGNSFLLKGWSATLVAALFALAAKDANKLFVVVSFMPVLAFWVIDAFFLSHERLFRKLYDKIRQQREEDIDFSMSTKAFRAWHNSWAASLLSRTLVLFYCSLILMMLVTMHFIV